MNLWKILQINGELWNMKKRSGISQKYAWQNYSLPSPSPLKYYQPMPTLTIGFVIEWWIQKCKFYSCGFNTRWMIVKSLSAFYLGKAQGSLSKLVNLWCKQNAGTCVAGVIAGARKSPNFYVLIHHYSLPVVIFLFLLWFFITLILITYYFKKYMAIVLYIFNGLYNIYPRFCSVFDFWFLTYFCVCPKDMQVE